MQGHWVRVRRLDSIEDQAIIPVVVEDKHLLLVRDGHRVHATERSCPHEGADLAAGRCANGKLFCPRHFAWFDLDDGHVGGGWDFPPIQVYRTKIIDDVVYVHTARLKQGSGAT